MMGKVTLALVITASLVGLPSYAANSDVSDAVAMGGVINVSLPAWEWRLNPLATTENQDLIFDVLDATESQGGSDLTWTFTPEEKAYFIGNLNKVTTSVDTFALVPEVKFSTTVLSQDMQKVTILATGDNSESGELALFTRGIVTTATLKGPEIQIRSFPAVSIFDGTIESVYSEKYSEAIASSALSFSKNSYTVTDIWNDAKGVSSPDSGPSPDSPYGAVFVGGVEKMELTFPRTNFPKTWSASLPIMVTMK